MYSFITFQFFPSPNSIMNTQEFEEIYTTFLKRKPNQGDINAHIHKNKDAFIEDFNNFLVSREAAFKGTIRVIEFDDAEIIDD